MSAETEAITEPVEVVPAGSATDDVVPATRRARHSTRSVLGLRLAPTPRQLVDGVCVALIAVQLVGLLIWSAHLAGLANLSWDFGIYYQPWSLIAHGHLLPRNTFQGGYLFMRNDGELIVYVLAPLYWLFPNHVIGYLWLQDLAITTVTAICFLLVADALPWSAARSRRDQLVAGAARLLVVLLVVADPWVYWTASFDIHMEVFGACFALLALRAALRGRRSVVAWALLGLLCGAASVLYVLGAGIAATTVLLWRRRHSLLRPAASESGAAEPGRGEGTTRTLDRRAAAAACWPLALSAAAVVWVGVLSLAHATVGSPSSGYAFLIGRHAGSSPSLARVVLGIAEHPGLAVSTVAGHGWNLWANTSPAGLVGLVTPALFIVAPQLLANNLLRTQAFSYPSFQNFICYGTLAVGSAAVVATLLRRRRLWPAGALLGAAMLLNSGIWFHDVFSKTSAFWVHMSPGSAAVVREVAGEAPSGDEVVASQGYLGELSGRQQAYSFSGPLVLPVRSSTVWFVLSLDQGNQVATHAETLEAIETIVHLPGVQTVAFDDNGVYVYRWHAPASYLGRSIRLGEPGSAYPIWMDPGDDAGAITDGPASSWGVASYLDQPPGTLGYLVFHDYFQLRPGRYIGEIRIQSTSAVTPEVWEGGNRLIAAVPHPVTARRPMVVKMPFTIPAPAPSGPLLWGSGLYRYEAIAGVPRASVEVRVWMANGTAARAWWTAIVPAPAR